MRVGIGIASTLRVSSLVGSVWRWVIIFHIPAVAVTVRRTWVSVVGFIFTWKEKSNTSCLHHWGVCHGQIDECDRRSDMYGECLVCRCNMEMIYFKFQYDSFLCFNWRAKLSLRNQPKDPFQVADRKTRLTLGWIKVTDAVPKLLLRYVGFSLLSLVRHVIISKVLNNDKNTTVACRISTTRQGRYLSRIRDSQFV